MTQYTVTVPDSGTATVFERGDLNSGVTVKNTGTVAVFLVQSPNAGQEYGYALSPGSSVVWQAGTPLFVSGTGGTVFITSNTGSLFDSDALANAIIRGGLADEIAQRISVEGAPPIRKSSVPFDPIMFVTGTGHVMPNRTELFATDWFSVSDWDILTVQLRDFHGCPENATFSSWVEFQEEGSGDTVTSNRFQFWPGLASYSTECRYDQARIYVTWNGIISGLPAGIYVMVDAELTVGGKRAANEYKNIPDSIWSDY